jgi:hypothetical protein
MSELNRTARIGRRLAGLLALTVVTAHAAFAQVVHYPDGKPRLPKWSSLPDWNGLWERDGDNVWDNRIPLGVPQDPPYNEEYRKRAVEGPPGPRGSAFMSMPGWMGMLFPMEIQINRGQLTIMSENKQPRRIYTDGRVASDDTLPSTLGYSTGRWVNGALIVKTCCVRADTRLPGGGPHSDELQIEERFYLRDFKTLVDEITVKDPKAFTQPWSTEKIWYRRPDWEPVEYDRTENDRESNGTTTVAPANTTR